MSKAYQVKKSDFRKDFQRKIAIFIKNCGYELTDHTEKNADVNKCDFLLYGVSIKKKPSMFGFLKRRVILGDFNGVCWNKIKEGKCKEITFRYFGEKNEHEALNLCSMLADFLKIDINCRLHDLKIHREDIFHVIF